MPSESERSSEVMRGHINLKDSGLLSFTRFLLTAIIGLVGGLSLKNKSGVENVETNIKDDHKRKGIRRLY